MRNTPSDRQAPARGRRGPCGVRPSARLCHSCGGRNPDTVGVRTVPSTEHIRVSDVGWIPASLGRPLAATKAGRAERNEKSRKNRAKRSNLFLFVFSVSSFLSANNSCQKNKMLRPCGAGVTERGPRGVPSVRRRAPRLHGQPVAHPVMLLLASPAINASRTSQRARPAGQRIFRSRDGITSAPGGCKSRPGKRLPSAAQARPRNLSPGGIFQLTRNSAISMVIIQPLNTHRDFIVNRKPP
jgi:hypothetical protein